MLAKLLTGGVGLLFLAVSAAQVFGATIIHCLSYVPVGVLTRQNDRIPSMPPRVADIPPFYVNHTIAEEWMRLKCGNTSVHQLCSNIGLHRYKHCDDYWLLKQSLVHPSRTRNPANAKWFIVPGLLNQIDAESAKFKQGCCIGNLCGYDQLRTKVDEDLASSEYFQRYSGADHIVVASHYATKVSIKRLKNVKQSNMISFEDQVHAVDDRITLPSNYVGGPCLPHVENKTNDVVFVGSMLVGRKNGSFAVRRSVCKSLQSQSLVSVSRCGGGSQCPAISSARYGFHIGGDTPGSNRLMDTFLSGTVPIFTNAKQYDVLPPFVPWKQMSLFLDYEHLEDWRQDHVVQVLRHALNSANYEQMVRLIVQWSPFLDWMGPSGKAFDFYISAFESLSASESKYRKTPISD